MAVDNKTKSETFMKMFEIQGGLGMGVKKFRVVFVFENEKVFDSFVNSGWQFGGQASAAAKTTLRREDPCRALRRFPMASGCIN